jgi:hypothetical protein
MKFLKRFNESKYMFDTNELGDILQELTDIGYLSHVESSWWSDDRSSGINICIYGKREYDKKINCNIDCIYPNEVIPVVERLVGFLNTEGYRPEDSSVKTIEVIKNRPVIKTKDEFNVTTSRVSQVRFKWDGELGEYKIGGSLSLYFRQ